MIKTACAVQYDPRTDQIVEGRSLSNPNLGSLRAADERGEVQIVQPVTGWQPYTHLIREEALEEESNIEVTTYYLAQIEDKA